MGSTVTMPPRRLISSHAAAGSGCRKTTPETVPGSRPSSPGHLDMHRQEGRSSGEGEGRPICLFVEGDLLEAEDISVERSRPLNISNVDGHRVEPCNHVAHGLVIGKRLLSPPLTERRPARSARRRHHALPESWVPSRFQPRGEEPTDCNLRGLSRRGVASRPFHGGGIEVPVHRIPSRKRNAGTATISAAPLTVSVPPTNSSPAERDVWSATVTKSSPVSRVSLIRRAWDGAST